MGDDLFGGQVNSYFHDFAKQIQTMSILLPTLPHTTLCLRRNKNFIKLAIAIIHINNNIDPAVHHNFIKTFITNFVHLPKFKLANHWPQALYFDPNRPPSSFPFARSGGKSNLVSISCRHNKTNQQKKIEEEKW